MHIAKLVIANIRHNKSATLSLFILTIVAASLLNIGLTSITQINSFFYSKAEKLGEPHASFLLTNQDYQPSHLDYIQQYNGVLSSKSEDVLLLPATTVIYGDSELSVGAILQNIETRVNSVPIQFIEQTNTVEGNDIYLPYIFNASGEYSLEDSFILTYKDTTYSFRVAGFFETTTFGVSNMGVFKYYMPAASYAIISEELEEEAQGKIISAWLSDRSAAAQLVTDFGKRVASSSSFYWGADIEMVKTTATMTINIIAMIIVSFALIIVVVTLIVINFRVTNSIEDGLVNIGTLKAIGYTSKQIRLSISLQFLLIIGCGGIAGALLSYILMPLFNSIISLLSGLHWEQDFNFIINLISLLTVVCLVLLVTTLSTFKISRLSPVTTLRGGILTHSFKKNYFPLAKSKIGLQLSLAIKAVVANSKQNIMIAIIISAITFASIFAIVLYYNIAKDKTSFIHLVGVESANALIIFNAEHSDDENWMDVFLKLDGVSKASMLDTIPVYIDNKMVQTTVSDDYSLLNNNIVYEGRQPKFNNEIVLSWLVAKALNKEIGELVEVSYNNTSDQYLITGLSQSMNYLGEVASLTLDGIVKLEPDYSPKMYNIYLDDINNATFISNFKAQYPDTTVDILDLDENISSQTLAYTNAMFAVMFIIIAITLFVVVLLLYLVVKTMIIRRKKEFGIMKALGYSTFNLMSQISYSFVPVVVVGTLIGGIIGILFTNDLLTALLSSAGIKNVDFIINLPSILLLCCGVIITAYLVTVLVARRIKGISAYHLITE